MKDSDIKRIVIHTSANKYNHATDIEDVRKSHKIRGFRDVGYHFFIKRDGTLQTGRALDVMGAHVKGYNADSWGICLAGGLDLSGVPEANFTIKQYSTLEIIITELLDRANDAEVVGHRDLSPDLNGNGVIEKNEFIKECPCFNVREWWYG